MTPPSSDRRSALRPPQFRLATLLGVMALLCAILAAMNLVGPIGAFALLLLFLSVLAHVSGNALGTRLRRLGDQPVDEHDRPLATTRRRSGPLPPAMLPNRLGERRRLGFWVVVIVLVAVVLSGGGGAWWTLHTGPQPPAPQDVALAAMAFGVLGGIWGLIGGGFLVVGFTALREAVRATPRSQPPVVP